jgi:hypothetical protein
MSDLPVDELPVPSSPLLSESMVFLYGVRYLLNRVGHTAVGIQIPDTSPDLTETIIVRGSAWSVIGIDDPEVWYGGSYFHVPDSMK